MFGTQYTVHKFCDLTNRLRHTKIFLFDNELSYYLNINVPFGSLESTSDVPFVAEDSPERCLVVVPKDHLEHMSLSALCVATLR